MKLSPPPTVYGESQSRVSARSVCIFDEQKSHTSPCLFLLVCLLVSHLSTKAGLLIALLSFAPRVSRVDHAGQSDMERSQRLGRTFEREGCCLWAESSTGGGGRLLERGALCRGLVTGISFHL